MIEEEGRGRAIVTYSRSWQALAAIRSLGRHGVDVVACDEVLVTPGSLSRYAVDRFEYPSPTTDPQGFIETLSEAVDRFRPLDPREPYVLLPIHDESYLLARERARFEGRIALALSPAEAFERLQHKRRLVELARQLGVPHPKTLTPASAEEVAAVADDLDYPVFLKMPRFSSGVGVRKVETPKELVEGFGELVSRYAPGPGDYPIVQALAEGQDYCTSGLWDDGELKAALTYKNVLAFPRERGPGAVRETVAVPRLEELAARLLGHVRWHGMAQVDFRWTGAEGDEPKVIEVNPRFFGGLFQAIESGVDYPWLLFRLAVDHCVPEPERVEVGLRTEAPITGFLATLAEIIEHDSKLDDLARAFRAARGELLRGEPAQALRAVFGGLRDSIDVSGRLERVHKVLEENSQNVSVLLDADDPLPVLGIFYPLAIFVRHGSLDPEVLTGATASRAP
jgi:predicted ATP-grasp superfamily ATP-dependent carboligase